MFQTIAVCETNIEQLRVSLASCPNFVPKALFTHLADSSSNKISAHTIRAYLDKGSKPGQSTSMEVCEEIVSEFDNDLIGLLAYKEFKNMVLPAANEKMRTYLLDQQKSRAKQYPPLSDNCFNLFSQLIAQERFLAAMKIKTRYELLVRKDYNAMALFRELANGKTSVTMQDLTVFCER